MSELRGAMALTLALVGATGCTAAATRRFALAPVVWKDDDMKPFAGKPAKYESAAIWDGADNTIFLPVSEGLRMKATREAVNVNAFDEVPDSSWFTNRIGQRPMTDEEVRLGPCDVLQAPAPPWTVVGGKPDGVNPGFFVKDAQGRRYLFKVDGALQTERNTGSDAVGTLAFHAAGYYAPCNRVVEFTRETFVIPPNTTITNKKGEKELLSWSHVDQLVAVSTKVGEGRYRGSLSQFIEGEPLGGFTYIGKKEDDPNDVFAHEHRREVRGMFVLDAWLDHIDSREENTMMAWMKAGKGTGYVRHYIIDFSDTLGVIWVVDAMSRRLGHSHYLDPGHVGADLITLGTMTRPWDRAYFPEATGSTFGYFDVDRFEPDAWHPGYPNPAFTARTEADDAWMARILAAFDEGKVETIARAGKWTTEVHHRALVATLLGRRAKILERYLTRLSPLTKPRVTGKTLCATDLAVTARLRAAADRRYTAHAYLLDEGTNVALAAPRSAPAVGDVCVELPAARGTTERPSYVVVDLTAATLGRETTGPLRVHLYSVGEDSFQVVGLERPHAASRPKG